MLGCGPSLLLLLLSLGLAGGQRQQRPTGDQELGLPEASPALAELVRLPGVQERLVEIGQRRLESQRQLAAELAAEGLLVDALYDRWLRDRDAAQLMQELGLSKRQDQGQDVDQDQGQNRDQEQDQDQDQDRDQDQDQDQDQGQDRVQEPPVAAAYYFYDVNTHLPANSPFGSAQEDGNQLSGPVNDPEEFEARLGQATAALNSVLSNSAARQALILGLINSTVGAPDLQADSSNQDGLAAADGDEHDEQPSDADDARTPASRYGASEYIDHPLALNGHQLVQGGAGEGYQLLGPGGSFENIQVVKSDSAVPAYCEPPNPCPIGYTAEDGCLERFVNSASFSREYQAKQQCSCDNEHSLFNCAAPEQPSEQATVKDAPAPAPAEGGAPGEQEEGKLATLARTIQNRFGGLAGVQRLMGAAAEHERQSSELESLDETDRLVRSARKWSPGLSLHKMELD